MKWSEDVVDNEFLNKKSSKSECCGLADVCGINEIHFGLPLLHMIAIPVAILKCCVLAVRVLHIPQAAAIWGVER